MLSTPLHPLLVHFPVAFLFLGSIVQLIALWRKKYFDRLAFFLIGFGWIMGIFAYLTGDGAEQFAEKQWGERIQSMVETHQTFATITLIVFGCLLAVKILAFAFEHYDLKLYGIRQIPFLKTMLFVLAIGGGVFITLTGHYGGKMVYQIPSHHKVVDHDAGSQDSGAS
ncbi:MAG TPA: DUF2231 domain-containing protein [Bacillales bacterium]|nr:DUF2231 domain-containing protein [Bacillales bacterium]